MAHQSISRLQVPDSPSATELSIFGTVNTTSGLSINSSNASLISEGTHSLGINQGLGSLFSYIANTSNVPIFRIDRVNPVSTAGRRTTLAFSGGGASEDMGSISVITEAAGQHGLRFNTATSYLDNTLPAISALSNNKVGVNILSPQFRLHLSDTGAVVPAAFIDATGLATITNEGTDAPTLNLMSFNDEMTAIGTIKGFKARGTTTSPGAVQNLYRTLALRGGGYDGTSVLTTAGIEFRVMGTVSTGVVPQGILFQTGTTNALVERARFSPAGNFGINMTDPLSTLVVSGGMSVGSYYNTTAVPQGSFYLWDKMKVGPFVGAPEGLIHTFSTSSNQNHIYVQTSTAGSAWLSFKNNVSSSLLPRIGLDGFTNGANELVMQIGGVNRIVATSIGLKYDQNYSASWTNRHLVDKEYVDNAVGGGGGGGITSINTLTAASQTLSTGASGTDFIIFSSGSNHNFILPDASAIARGVITTGAQVIGGTKTFNAAPVLDSLTASLPLKVNGSKTVISALIDLSTDVTGILPPGNGGTGGGSPTWVDLTTNQVNIAGDKGFTTSLHYGAAILPTSSHFGTTVGTNVYFAGSTTAITESNFNNSQGFIISNHINSGTQFQTTRLIAAGSDTFNSASAIEFNVRHSGSGQNWIRGARLATLGSNGEAAFYVGNSATGVSGGNIAIHGGNVSSLIGFETPTGGPWVMGNTNDSTNTFIVSQNGSIRAHIVGSVDGWVVGSDVRKKENIETLTVLPLINHVRGASYNLRENPDRRVVGVIAQEIEEVFPEAVFTDETPEKMKSVSYNAIASIALQGVRELKQYIDILENRITKLEKEIKNNKQ